MKPVSLALVPVLAAGLVACQQKSGPAAAAPTPSPVAAAAAAPESPGVPAEAPAAATPAPAAASTAHRATPAARPAEPLPPAGPAVATSEPAPVPVAPPAAAPAPTPEPIVVAAGTVLPVRLQDMITTKTAQPEDRVVAILEENVSVGGRIVLPAGSEVYGSVVSSERSGRVKGRAHLVVAFNQVRAGHRTYSVSLSGFDVTAESSKGKDAKIAGGAAAAGVIIGAIADGGSGAAKGGLIGGAAGGAAVLATRGKEVELAAGSRYRLTLKKSLTIQQ